MSHVLPSLPPANPSLLHLETISLPTPTSRSQTAESRWPSLPLPIPTPARHRMRQTSSPPLRFAFPAESRLPAYRSPHTGMGWDLLRHPESGLLLFRHSSLDKYAECGPRSLSHPMPMPMPRLPIKDQIPLTVSPTRTPTNLRFHILRKVDTSICSVVPNGTRAILLYRL